MTTIQLLNGVIITLKNYSDYTADELKIIIKNSSSIHDVILKLKINRYYHTYIKKFIKDNNIDTSHFTQIQKLKENFEDKLTKIHILILLLLKNIY